METVYHIIKLIAISVNFCVFMVNFRLMFDSYLSHKTSQLLEEKRLTVKETLLLDRERWRELHE